MEVTHVGDESRLGLFCKLYFSLAGVILNNKKLGEHFLKKIIYIIVLIIIIIKFRLSSILAGRALICFLFVFLY